MSGDGGFGGDGGFSGGDCGPSGDCGSGADGGSAADGFMPVAGYIGPGTDGGDGQDSKRSRWRDWYGPLIAILLLVGAGGWFVWENLPKKVSGRAGPDCRGVVGTNLRECAADFTVPMLKADGSEEKVSLSQFANKPTILYFWSTDCGYCRQEIPIMQKLQERYKDVQILFVNNVAAESGGAKGVHAVAQKFPKPLSPVLLDNVGVFSEYKVQGIPDKAILDKDLRVVERFRGAQPPDNLRKLSLP